MIEKVLAEVAAARSILVAAHESPDGDALASTLALALVLEEQGKQVVAFNRDGVPNDFRFLPGQDKIVDRLPSARQFDLGFVLDAGRLERAGSEIGNCCRTLINIDHHPDSDPFGTLNYVDPQASATGALVYRLIEAAGWSLSLPVAVNIYTAILADTGSFRYSNADPEAFRIAGAMVALGVDPWVIAAGLYESQEEARLRLLALALPTLQVADSGKYASIVVTLDMYEEAGAHSEHTDRFVNYPRSISGVEVAIFLRQLDDQRFKIGFRSRGSVDVGSLARELGGGGHHNAAGATLEGTLPEIKARVFAMVDRLLA